VRFDQSALTAVDMFAVAATAIAYSSVDYWARVGFDHWEMLHEKTYINK
jgi:hypothetical protein